MFTPVHAWPPIFFFHSYLLLADARFQTAPGLPYQEQLSFWKSLEREVYWGRDKTWPKKANEGS